MTMLGDLRLHGVHGSYIGGSHEKCGKCCQDASSISYSSDYAIACVADGHGSDRYVRSHRGSKFAVGCSINTIRDYLEEVPSEDILSNPDDILDNIVRTIIARWNACVNDDYQHDSLSSIEESLVGDVDNRPVEKLYGTTLIIGVITRSFAFGLQIGDGSFTVHRGSIVEMPMPDDPECVGNITTSLCDMSAFSKFRRWFSTDVPDAIMVSTDGLYTTFPSDADFKEYCNKMVNLSIRENYHWDLLNVNLNKRAHAGHEDDVSVSIVGFGSPTWTVS